MKETIWNAQQSKQRLPVGICLFSGLSIATWNSGNFARGSQLLVRAQGVAEYCLTPGSMQ